MPASGPTLVAVYCLLALIVAGDLLLYSRLKQQKLDRIYRTFSLYLLFDAVYLIVSNVLPPVWYGLRHHPYRPYNNNFYAFSWAAAEPIEMILQLLVVLELYSLVLGNYKGVASMGRWAVTAGLVIAIVLSSLAIPSELSHATKFPILQLYNVAIRGVDASLVLFLLFITAFLVWVPIPLNRNVVLYSVGYASYFTVRATAELAQNLMTANLWSLVSLATLTVYLLCLALWILFLNREGESKRALIMRNTWVPERQEFLMRQLAAINASLTRSGPG